MMPQKMFVLSSNIVTPLPKLMGYRAAWERITRWHYLYPQKCPHC